ncbi:MAG: dehydrogenase [Sulfobacillus acidophilus]|uniref:Dehydrogenase n=1 Tax=Sulfobacillus acidophilus TaxID=53633 RepID=A0A2T2WJZ8_9FIRM|nr:MAG: dehydrogenase [Sulfobacillus acidophilus]
MQLEGKVCAVTGAAGAIGFSIAQEFLREGARVALIDIDGAKLSTLLQALRQEGYSERDAFVWEADVGQQLSIRDALSAVTRILGPLDVIVANAGIARSEAFLETTAHTWNETLRINLTGVFYTVQEAARHMVAQHAGSIITMSSTNGLMAEKNLAAYNASKAGIMLLTKTLAIELAPYGIRANALNPGVIDTGLAQKAGLPEEEIQGYLSKIPLGRLGQPREVARAAVFLASDASSYITGHGLVIDGGQLAEE